MGGPDCLSCEGSQINAIGDIHDRPRHRTQSEQIFSGKSTDGYQGVGILKGLDAPLIE
jgi:hypothetical protein